MASPQVIPPIIFGQRAGAPAGEGAVPPPKDPESPKAGTGSVLLKSARQAAEDALAEARRDADALCGASLRTPGKSRCRSRTPPRRRRRSPSRTARSGQVDRGRDRGPRDAAISSKRRPPDNDGIYAEFYRASLKTSEDVHVGLLAQPRARAGPRRSSSKSRREFARGGLRSTTSTSSPTRRSRSTSLRIRSRARAHPSLRPSLTAGWSRRRSHWPGPFTLSTCPLQTSGLSLGGYPGRDVVTARLHPARGPAARGAQLGPRRPQGFFRPRRTPEDSKGTGAARGLKEDGPPPRREF